MTGRGSHVGSGTGACLLQHQCDAPVIETPTPAFAVTKAAAGAALCGGDEFGAATPAVRLISARRAIERRLAAVIAVAIAKSASPAPEAAAIVVAAIPIVVIPEVTCDAKGMDGCNCGG